MAGRNRCGRIGPSSIWRGGEGQALAWVTSWAEHQQLGPVYIKAGLRVSRLGRQGRERPARTRYGDPVVGDCLDFWNVAVGPLLDLEHSVLDVSVVFPAAGDRRVFGAAHRGKCVGAGACARLGQGPLDEIRRSGVGAGAAFDICVWSLTGQGLGMVHALYDLAQHRQPSVAAALEPVEARLGQALEASYEESGIGEGAVMVLRFNLAKIARSRRGCRSKTM